MYPSLKQQNPGDDGPPSAQLPPPPQSSSTRRYSGGSTVTRGVNGVTSIKISTPPSSSIPSPSVGLTGTGSIGGNQTSTPNKYTEGSTTFNDDTIDDELELNIPESDLVPNHLPPRRIPCHRGNRVGLSVSASSSPEVGVSPHTLAEQGWKSFDGADEDKWVEEGRLLIEPGEDEEDDDVDACDHSKEPESDEDAEENLDIWSMTRDQQEYYRKQFQSLLGSIGGSKVSGVVAREFFVRSKLASSELSDIWRLADIDKDGSLNLAEFSIAMHLVVLRKKAAVDVPLTLPKSLVSSALKINPAFQSKSLDVSNNRSDESNLIDMSCSPGKLIENIQILGLKEQNKEWTKFTDSPTAKKNKPPTTGRSEPSNHGQKVNSFLIPSDLSSADDSSRGLVNFDFPSSSIDHNPCIVHPVALRLTPEGQCLVASPEPSLPRQPGRNQPLIPPPIPPPRPSVRLTSGHARSSSLDLNKLQGNNRRFTWSSNGGSGQFYYGVAAQPPNITSMSPSNLVVGVNDDHHGAFLVYKKAKSPMPPPKSGSKMESDHTRTLKVIQSQFGLEPLPSLIPNNPCDTNELMRCLKLSNDRITQLEQINQILMEKLAETVDKNIDLETKLSKLKAAGDLINRTTKASLVIDSNQQPNQGTCLITASSNCSVQCTKT